MDERPRYYATGPGSIPRTLQHEVRVHFVFFLSFFDSAAHARQKCLEGRDRRGAHYRLHFYPHFDAGI